MYKVISLHFTRDCNLNCSFCYRKKKPTKNKPFKFFIDMIPYLSKLTKQIAIGGGEPFLYPHFLMEFAKKAKKYGLIVNVTTNGTLPMKDYVDDIEMVSVSFDSEKIKYKEDIDRFVNALKELKGKTKIGVNFLMEYDKDPLIILNMTPFFFKGIKVDSLYALCPKKWKSPNILKYKGILLLISELYPNFYVDDLTYKIITENKYSNWDSPCHYGTGIISIDEQGYVYGCSFDDEPLLKLNKPNDILKIKDIKIKKRYSCPYLIKNGKN